MKKLVVILIGIISYYNSLAQQPRLVKDINQVGGSSNPSGFFNVNGMLFIATQNDYYKEVTLFKSDGTNTGTIAVKPLIGFIIFLK